MKVFFYMINSYWRFLFFKDKKYHLVWEDLIYKHSFRYGERDKYSYKIFFVYFKQSLRLLFEKSNNDDSLNKSSLIYDLSSKSKESRLLYVKSLTGKQDYEFIAREQLNGGSLGYVNQAGTFLCLLLVFMFSILISPFYKLKANLALLQLEYVELAILSHYLKKNKVKKFLFFSAYEKDACFISNYLISSLNIHVQLIPSSNPISKYYIRVICSTFTFTVVYQEKECDLLKHNWMCDEFLFWPIADYGKIITTIGRTTKPYTIGFVSSGNWLRKRIGHVDLGEGYFEAEKNLLDILKSFITVNEDWKLYISLHPLERRNKEYLESSNEYYSKIFGDKFDFVPFDKVTRESPEIFDIAISGYSSATFERLFAGYKTLFSQKGMQENFYGDERLSSITCNTSESFEKLISEISEIDHDEFFKKFDLTSYRYKSNSEYMETFKM